MRPCGHPGGIPLLYTQDCTDAGLKSNHRRCTAMPYPPPGMAIRVSRDMGRFLISFG